jgi:hypothetical protein
LLTYGSTGEDKCFLERWFPEEVLKWQPPKNDFPSVFTDLDYQSTDAAFKWNVPLHLWILIPKRFRDKMIAYCIGNNRLENYLYHKGKDEGSKGTTGSRGSQQGGIGKFRY